MEMRSEISKCATLCMLVDRNQQKGREKMHNREHINLYCSANITKQVTHIMWENIIH